MPEERYPRILLYGQLSEDVRPAHCPKKRYKDLIKKTMKNFGMRPGDLEANLLDHIAYGDPCAVGVQPISRGAGLTRGSFDELEDTRCGTYPT